MTKISGSRWIFVAGCAFLSLGAQACSLAAQGSGLLGASSGNQAACSSSISSISLAASGDEGRMVAPMTQSTMELIFAGEVEAILGPSGAIQTKIDGINIYLISDPVHDRMRIIAPIALTNKLDPKFLQVMLEANFHRTGDARYSTSEGVVYAAFMHPIASLTPALLKSALAQVLSLANTFGTRFSSGVLETQTAEPSAPIESEDGR